MTQIAQVTSAFPNGMAAISVHRKSACSHDCSKCSGCQTTFTQADITVNADNQIGACTGDTVLVESANSDIIFAAFLVYLVPFILFFAGYIIGKLLSFGEGMSIAAAFAGFVIGFLPARKLEQIVREKRAVQFRIVEITNSCSDI